MPGVRNASLLCACLLLAEVVAAAENYPSKPIRLILPIAPGGAVDTIARNIGQKLSERLGQQVVIDNRAGGGGSMGAELTARAAPDGYTLMLAGSAFLVYSLLYRAPYNPVRDFAPVTQLVKHPYVMAVASSVPAATVSEFVSWAKANPDKVNYASSGNGSLIHLTGELLKARTGIAMAHIPYKGIALGFIDMLAGRVQATFASPLSTLPYVKSGRLRALGVTSTKRISLLPDLPTLDEAGVKGFEVTQWFGVFAPPGTPSEITSRVQREIAAILSEKEQAQRMAAEGSEILGNTPAEFAREVRAEYARWDTVIRQAHIKGE